MSEDNSLSAYLGEVRKQMAVYKTYEDACRDLEEALESSRHFCRLAYTTVQGEVIAAPKNISDDFLDQKKGWDDAVANWVREVEATLREERGRCPIGGALRVLP